MSKVHKQTGDAKTCSYASPVTTARYDRQGEAAKRKAAASLLHTPYVRS